MGQTIAAPGRYATVATAPRALRSTMKAGQLARVMEAAEGLRQAEEQIERERRDLVRGMRSLGVSWGSIGFVLGVTGSAVRQRYGQVDAEVRR